MIREMYANAIEYTENDNLLIQLFGLILQKILIFFQGYLDKNGKLNLPSLLNPIFLISAAKQIYQIGKMIKIYFEDKKLFKDIYLNKNTNYQAKIKALEIKLKLAS